MTNSIFKHQLGDKVRDKVTAFTGIIIARSEYLNDCIRYGVQSVKLTNDGKPLEPEWFDEKQLTVIKVGAVKYESELTGGPAITPRLSANPKA